MPAPRRPDPEPLENDDVRVVALGTAAWVVAFLALGAARLAGAGIHDWWLVMSACGAVLGVGGVRFCQARRSAIARDREPSRLGESKGTL